MLMRSLFLGWPQEKLSQIYFPLAVTHMPDAAVCREYRLIRVSGNVQRVNGAEAAAVATTRKQGSPRGSGPRWRRAVAQVTRRSEVMRWLRPGFELWYAHSWLGAVLERQLGELRPDIVYALLGNYCLTKLTCLACERLGIPLFVHVTDDFVTSLYGQMPFGSRLQAASESWFRRTVGLADGVAAISPVMAEDYGHRYGKPWNWFTTLIDAGAYDPSPRAADGTIRLVYAGNLGLGRWRSLVELGAALRALREEDGIDARLTIYSTPEQIEMHRGELSSPPVVELGGWLAPKELPRAFHDADVLVHAESFDPAVANYTRLSFSTKLSQYMMAGRGVLMFGPTEIGSARMIE
ncbi:MAG: glycosyltransferase, partial [Planctomycetaceae bacterium]|nr:glycosyltransferase [Planctomycetaceae bacterium]